MFPYGGEIPTPRPVGTPRTKDEVKIHAEDFLQQYYTSINLWVPNWWLAVVWQQQPLESHNCVFQKPKQFSKLLTLFVASLFFPWRLQLRWRGAPKEAGRGQQDSRGDWDLWLDRTGTDFCRQNCVEKCPKVHWENSVEQSTGILCVNML